jgi:hypothetical protein
LMRLRGRDRQQAMCPLLGEKRKTSARIEDFAFWTRNGHGRAFHVAVAK